MLSELKDSDAVLDDVEEKIHISALSNVNHKSRRESLGNTQYTGLRGQNNTRLSNILLKIQLLPMSLFTIEKDYLSQCSLETISVCLVCSDSASGKIYPR